LDGLVTICGPTGWDVPRS